MKKILIRILTTTALVIAFAAAANAQASSTQPARSGSSRNPAVIVVSSAAKAAWVTTKFVVKDVAKPTAKIIFLKAAPKIALFGLKRTPGAAKRLAPIAVRLALL